jgi:hypothetical protein
MRAWQGGVTLAALWLTGCAWGPEPGGAASLAAAIGLLWLAACTNVTPTEAPAKGDGGTRDGTHEACCVEGRLTTCYCPPQMACNYGRTLVVCDDGTCSNEPTAQCPTDGGSIDAGTWEPCCTTNGVLTTCYCPPKTACNYGLGWVSCGEGTCASTHWGEPDAGDPCQRP